MMGTSKTAFVTEPGQRTVTMTRAFDAPCGAVFDAMTKPELLRKWYGPPGVEVTICESDLRVGGAYRIVQRAPDGNEFGFRGVHRELSRPDRRVYTWVFELMPDKEAIITETFENRGGKTFFTSELLFQTVEDRDGYLSFGATAGGEASMDRLEAFLHAGKEQR
jgi:uncharacterized protein YndB with AHSA1/START domain